MKFRNLCFAAIGAFALSTAAQADIAPTKKAACPKPEKVMNKGSKSEYCAPSAAGKCAPGNEIGTAFGHEKACVKAASHQGGSPCPAPEKVMNKGSKSEYCAPGAGKKCGPGRVLGPNWAGQESCNKPFAHPRLG
jgi:hypothetical protein